MVDSTCLFIFLTFALYNKEVIIVCLKELECAALSKTKFPMPLFLNNTDKLTVVGNLKCINTDRLIEDFLNYMTRTAVEAKKLLSSN